jgi:hypothetical protein
MRILLLTLISSLLLATNYKDVKRDDKLVKRYVYEISHMSGVQMNNIIKVYNRFDKYNLGTTGVCILIHESKAGKYMFNPTTGDYGLLGINLKTYMVYKGIKQNYYSNIRIASILIKDDDINIQASIDNILFWKKVHKGNWIKMLGSYNGGYKPNYKYAKELYNIAIAFRIIMRKRLEK